ncbi:calcium-responsive transcription factor-like [Polymixia lowei]
MLDISTSPAGPVTMVTEANRNSSSVSVAKMTVQLPTSTSQDIFTTTPKPLPAKTPHWAQRLHNAEKIGESYRGYCTTESELEAILVLHKQQTGCVFGTRQSPSPVKPATRLMWRSQYVPYDGIPFVNAGSRAIVMECQYGPRRKGLQPKKNTEHTPTDYKTTCPARIYIKKVRKFPEFCVPMEPTVDRKTVRQDQEKAFSSLRSQPLDTGGALRYYMQLPTEKAHLYHDVDTPIPPPPPDLPPPLQEQQEEEEEGGEEAVMEDGSLIPSRLHPRVAERIKELVAQGHQQVYSVRKQLRHFVEREMFKSEGVPERHNLCYFPTVNDIKNHIHEAQRALGLTGWTGVCSDPLSETVTLTLTPATSEVVLEGSDTLSPEAVQLFSSLSSLQPKMFAQLQGAQPHPVTSLSHPSTQEPPPPRPLPQPLTPDSSTSPGLLDLVNPLSSPSPTLSPPQLIVSSSGQLELSHSSSSPSLHVSPQASPSQSLHSSPSLHVSPQASPSQSLHSSPSLHVSPQASPSQSLHSSPSLHVSPQASPSQSLHSSPSLHVSPQASPSQSLHSSPSLHVSPQASPSQSLHSSPSLHVSPQASPSQSLPVSPTSFLHTSSPLGESLGNASPQTVLGVGQMVSVSAPEDEGTHQIILEDGQTIPVQIVDPSTIALTSPNVLQVEVKEEEEDEAREEEEDGIKVEDDDSVS